METQQTETIYGYPARLVIDVEGEEVTVTDALSINGESGEVVVDAGRVLRAADRTREAKRIDSTVEKAIRSAMGHIHDQMMVEPRAARHDMWLAGVQSAFIRLGDELPTILRQDRAPSGASDTTV